MHCAQSLDVVQGYTQSTCRFYLHVLLGMVRNKCELNLDEFHQDTVCIARRGQPNRCDKQRTRHQ